MPQYNPTLLERFLQYVQIETTSDPASQSVPSTACQLDLGRVLLDQLKEMGVSDCSLNENGVVLGTIETNQPGDQPTLIFNAHIDTSPDASGKNVKPNVLEYQGGDITLQNGEVITVEKTPALKGLVGKTLITTDGTTLLGGDDKAGVSIIMEIAKFLCENPDHPRPHVKVLFTCDEEIGRGTYQLDVPALGGTVCYTFDGGGEGVIDDATFSADHAVITFKGINIHPAMAKDKMVNAIRAAGYFLSLLPPDISPECTEGLEGFVHPYDLSGSVQLAEVKILLRDFDSENLRNQEAMIREKVQTTLKQFPGLSVDVQVSKQYRNLAEGLAKEPRALELAKKAMSDLGIEYRLDQIRGGTDGSQLTEKGLPTPNLSSGQHNLHCEREFACAEQMQQAVEVGKNLVRLWAGA